MKKGKNKWLFIFLMFPPVVSLAQDSTFQLDKDEFLSIVRSFHPVLSQAGLQVDIARTGVLQARSVFDPSIDAGLERKKFGGILYYNYFNPQITIPAWYGIDVKAGIEEVMGDKVNQEATFGKTSYIGIKIPANNLFFDKRRAVINQAKSMQQLSEAERLLIINNLLYDAFATYWEWVKEYQLYQVINDAVKVNEERLRFVRIEYEQGAKPAIDTIEALAQLQNFYLQQNAAWLSFQNAGLELSNFLWLENSVPLAWSPAIVPVGDNNRNINQIPSLESLINVARTSHPKLKSIGYKMEVLEIDRRLKAQYLLPKFSINANLLNKGYNVLNELTIPVLENNYKLGFDLSMPLFFRDARGAYRASKFKIEQTMLDQDLASLQIENKIKSYYNEVLQLDKQIGIYEQAYHNYVRLFQGEKLRFEIGESTLFLLNTRENKVLEIYQKLLEARTKWHKSFAGLLRAAGQLN